MEQAVHLIFLDPKFFWVSNPLEKRRETFLNFEIPFLFPSYNKMSGSSACVKTTTEFDSFFARRNLWKIENVKY